MQEYVKVPKEHFERVLGTLDAADPRSANAAEALREAAVPLPGPEEDEDEETRKRVQAAREKGSGFVDPKDQARYEGDGNAGEQEREKLQGQPAGTAVNLLTGLPVDPLQPVSGEAPVQRERLPALPEKAEE